MLRRSVELPFDVNLSSREVCDGLEGANGEVDGLAVTGASGADIGDHGLNRLAVVLVDDRDPSSAVGGSLGVVGPVLRGS
jgi:hypothetical protein